VGFLASRRGFSQEIGASKPLGARLLQELRNTQPERSLVVGWRERDCSVWGTNGRLKAPQRTVELARNLEHAEPVAAEEFGVQSSKGRAEQESDAKNPCDRHQAAVGQWLKLALRIATLRPMFTGMQEAMLKGPVLGEIAPPIVF